MCVCVCVCVNLFVWLRYGCTEKKYIWMSVYFIDICLIVYEIYVKTWFLVIWLTSVDYKQDLVELVQFVSGFGICAVDVIYYSFMSIWCMDMSVYIYIYIYIYGWIYWWICWYIYDECVSWQLVWCVTHLHESSVFWTFLEYSDVVAIHVYLVICNFQITVEAFKFLNHFNIICAWSKCIWYVSFSSTMVSYNELFQHI